MEMLEFLPLSLDSETVRLSTARRTWIGKEIEFEDRYGEEVPLDQSSGIP